METTFREVMQLEEALNAAKKRLAKERVAAELRTTPKEVLKTLSYDQMKSNSIACRGPFGEFVCPSFTYDIGTAMLPMEVFRRSKVLDFSVYLHGLFRVQASTIAQKVDLFLDGKLNEIRSYDLFLLPIDLSKKAQGRRADLPNVTFFLTSYLLRNHVDLVVVDPIFKEKDTSVRIVNLARVLRYLQDQRLRILTPFDKASVANETSLDLVVYQRGNGDPDERTRRQIFEATSLTRESIMHVHLTPGKYEQGKCTWGGNCYRDFKQSVTDILHELQVVDPFTLKMKKRAVHKIYVVLDEFAAYSAFTAVAILGYGIEDVTSILAYHQGTYTPT